ARARDPTDVLSPGPERLPCAGGKDHLFGGLWRGKSLRIFRDTACNRRRGCVASPFDLHAGKPQRSASMETSREIPGAIPSGCHSGLGQREREWGRNLAALMLGWLALETLTGLSIYYLPFSLPNQWMVLVHTGVGLLFLIPALAYQVRHLAVYWVRPSSAVK